MFRRKYNDSAYEPHILEFLREYYNAKFPYFALKTRCLCPSSGPKLTRLGSCNLIRRSSRSKLRNTNLTSVLFVNMSSKIIQVTVEGRCTQVTGCGIGFMGNNVGMSVDPSENKKQIFTISPKLKENNFIKKFRGKRWYPKLLYNSEDDSTEEKISTCLASSSALIDPCTYTYYCSARIVDKNGKLVRNLFSEILHHSNCDVLFKDKHIDTETIDEWINWKST